MKTGRRSRLDRNIDDAVDRATRKARQFRGHASETASDLKDRAKKAGRHVHRKSATCKASMPEALNCAGRFARRNPLLVVAGAALAGYALTCLIRDKDDKG